MVVRCSQVVDVARVENVGNDRLTTWRGRAIGIADARYDAATNSVWFTAASQLSVRNCYRLSIDNDSKTGLVDTLGNWLEPVIDFGQGGR